MTNRDKTTYRDKTHLTPLGKLVALVVALSLSAVAGATAATAVRPHAREWRCHLVRPGDTIWNLASEVAEGDVREAVYRIVEHNDLGGAPIQPGTGIWVPRGGVQRAEADRALCPAPAD